MAGRHLRTYIRTAKGLKNSSPFSLLPVAFSQLLQERDGNRALSKQPVLQPKSEAACHAEEEGKHPPHAGEKLRSPLALQEKRRKQTNKQNISPLKPSPTLEVSVCKRLFFGHYVGCGSSPLGVIPQPPHPPRRLQAGKPGAVVTPTDPAAKCSPGPAAPSTPSPAGRGVGGR